LGNGTAALDVGLFDQNDLEVSPPVPRFVSGATTTKATAYDEDVGIDELGSSAPAAGSR
jgi:hypothetical protein